jgi:hypothetical protein
METQQELSFTYFPENYRWSHGLLIALNMAPWGGAEIGEINRIGLRLKDRVGDDEAWFREWAREARTVEDRGRERIAEGFTKSGAQYLQRASAYYHVGERFLRRNTSSARSWSMSKFRMAIRHCRAFWCMRRRRTALAKCRRWSSSTASTSPRRFNISKAFPIWWRAGSPV